MITQSQFLSHMNIQAPAWTASTKYGYGDYVISSGTYYQCKEEHTSGVSFDSTKFTADTVALQCVTAAIEHVNAYCNRDFRLADYTEVFEGDGSNSKWVRNAPVNSLTSIKKLNTDTNEFENIFTAPDTKDNAARILGGKVLLLRTSFTAGALYEMAYNGGYSTAPIAGVTLEIAQDMWNNSAGSGQSRLGLSSENIGGQSSNGKGFDAAAVMERFKSKLDPWRIPNV